MESQEPKQVGRPTVITPDVLDKLETAFALGCTDNEACLYANISPRSLYYHQEQNPEFLQRKELLKDQPLLKARMTIVDSLDNPTHAQWYLSRKLKKEFSERIEQTGADGKDLPTPILAITNVSTNNSNQQDTEAIEAHQSDTRGDISLQDDIDSLIPDSIIPVGQDIQADEYSVGVDASPQERGDEGLSDNPEGT